MVHAKLNALVSAEMHFNRGPSFVSQSERNSFLNFFFSLRLILRLSTKQFMSK